MRSYFLHEAGRLSMADVPDPECGAEEIILETEAVSICSTDVSYFRGHLVPERWPVIPGHEYVGRVVEVGTALRGKIRQEERITYWGQTDFGGLAEYRAVRPLLPGVSNRETSWLTDRGFADAHQAAAVVLPAHLPNRLATLIEPLTSVLRTVLSHPPRPGDTIVILGAGPTALIAIQVLRHCHAAGSLVVVERDAARRATALRLGADLVFDPITDADALRGLADDHLGAFADYVFDALPHVDSTSKASGVRAAAMQLLKATGKYVLFGATAIPQAIDTWLLLAKGLKFVAAPFDVRAFPMSRTAHVIKVATNLVDSGVLDIDQLITGTVSFWDEGGVGRVFSEYGHNGTLRTSIAFDATSDNALKTARSDKRNSVELLSHHR
ncbi:alcohol dehydrogenase catalytic domain-containing protein [Nonomuraea sp. NPDC026600]|uniref:zinc-dependent alcohol dehydrogenase n=1 Tax=Nonomuraea sp. NPDC026600 TaxID=3155363 RepID=UPI0033D6387C